MHASDHEWYSLVKAGARLGIFSEVEENDRFIDGNGQMVLQGAIGVDKVKMMERTWVV